MVTRPWVLERVAMAAQHLAASSGKQLGAELGDLYRALDVVVRYARRPLGRFSACPGPLVPASALRPSGCTDSGNGVCASPSRLSRPTCSDIARCHSGYTEDIEGVREGMDAGWPSVHAVAHVSAMEAVTRVLSYARVSSINVRDAPPGRAGAAEC